MFFINKNKIYAQNYCGVKHILIKIECGLSFSAVLVLFKHATYLYFVCKHANLSCRFTFFSYSTILYHINLIDKDASRCGYTH